VNRQQRRAEERKAAKGSSNQREGFMTCTIDHIWPGGEKKAQRLADSGEMRLKRSLEGWKEVFAELERTAHQTCSHCQKRIDAADDIAAISVFHTCAGSAIESKLLVLGVPFCKQCLPTQDEAKISALAKSVLGKLFDTKFMSHKGFVPVTGMPVPTAAVTVSDFLESGEVTDSQTLANFVIGGRGRLTRDDAAESAKQLAKLLTQASPTAPVYLCIVGYDHDPCELYEIPETKTFLGWFATEFDKAGCDPSRVIKQSRDMLELGRHIAAGHNVEVTGSGNTVARLADDVAAFQDAAMRKLS
jgi:hypothetical protein